jgi:predicted nucleic acid-binding Zn finger protein
MSTSYDEALATQPFKHRLDKRDRRALSEQLIVLEDAPDIYTVYSEAGEEYIVDTRGPACTCPDFRYREADCKHIRRARIEAGDRDLADLDSEIQNAIDALDDHLANLTAQRAELIDLQHDLDQLRANHCIDETETP